MLYLFYGPGSKSKMSGFAKNGEIFRITDLDFNLAKFNELVDAQGLFNQKIIVFLTNVCSQNEKEIEAKLEDLKNSKNDFIFIENEVSPRLLVSFQEKGQVFFGPQKTAAKPVFNVFDLTDCFGRRDKKKSWLLFLTALNQLSPEEIAQLLFWQIKTLLLVKTASRPTELNLNPYVLKKNLVFSKNFSLAELQEISRELVSIFHEARRKNRDLAIDLERFILKTL